MTKPRAGQKRLTFTLRAGGKLRIGPNIFLKVQTPKGGKGQAVSFEVVLPREVLAVVVPKETA